MNQKHTPGPWKVIPPGHGHPTEYLCVQLGADEMYTTLEMLPADARLVAASPDLLAVLQRWVDVCGGFDAAGDPVCELTRQSLYVLNKARGEG